MKRTTLGVTLTALVIGAVVWYMATSWEAVVKLAPNEFGDSIAGVAATLAFIWIVIGYFQQGQELRENTAALASQQKELEAQANYMQQMAQFAGAQADAMRGFAESAKLQARELDKLADATKEQAKHDRDLASAAKEVARAAEKLANAISSIERKVR